MKHLCIFSGSLALMHPVTTLLTLHADTYIGSMNTMITHIINQLGIIKSNVKVMIFLGFPEK